MHLKPALLFCGLFSLNLFAAGESTQTKTNIAVSDLTGQGVDQASASVIGDRLRTELFNTGIFKVIERQSMQNILMEQGFQQTDCVTDQCMLKVGQLLGVSNIISGTVGKLGGMFTLNIRIIDIKTGEIGYTTSVDCQCEIEAVLTKSVPLIVQKIATYMGKPVTAAANAHSASPQAPVGSLYIQTDPPGARIFIDNMFFGLTPFTNNRVGSGSHFISIRLAGYDEVQTTVSVSSGGIVNKNFTLSITKASVDSVGSSGRAAEALPNAGKSQSKTRIGQKIVIGALGVGFGVAGIVFNSKESDYIKKDSYWKQQFVASGYTNTNYYQSQLQSNTTAAKNSNTMRNISYILACACGAGFAVSFAF